ncbi:unnamed protein product [Porites lobata]|uniref:Uncharacterized protein n=1 Tax=Porites lobata TaxID=104759 RepID=A0ABN8Q639_9CNID|nr:unnamed protein product [Porites lobata]
MDKSLNREMFNKFESSDFDFCIAEHKELPLIKICSDEGRDDCQQLKPKATQASFGTTVITAKKELGLVDAVSRDEFDAVLESLYPAWTKRELAVNQ